ncbi:site-specific integrase [Erysipelothrix sp. HDW6C]|uniref:tyrosine-type recombinase/integrase n=1 Tax=Erysipelothrix sp. HDW6C TaxID=2714930 RepID=UPI00140AEE4C|nr:site-specific integrase [Erysipelothrix sp. HDW6C]QIK68770.1 site-specific integrase [Erysipelothrix sp. HDW6C]
MAVKKIKDGLWETRISYRQGDKVLNKQKRFPSKGEASKFEVDFKERLEQGNDHNVTYVQLIDNYLELNSTHANESTIKDKRFMIQQFSEHLYTMPYSKITKSHMMDIYLMINKKEWSTVRKNKALSIFKAISKFGHDHYDYPDKTKALIRFRMDSTEVNETQVWTPKELQRFLLRVKSVEYKTLYWFMYYTGVRLGEALALTKQDFKEKTVSINKSIRSYEQGFQPLKTAGSKRVISLDDLTHSKVSRLFNSEGDFVFGSLTPLSRSNVQRTFKAALENANVPDIRLHDLRHSHATLLINNNANIVAVSKRLGHTDVQTTLRTYTHLFKETDNELINILNTSIKK